MTNQPTALAPYGQNKVSEHTRLDLTADAVERIHDSYTPHVKAFVAFLRETGQGVTLDAVREYIVRLNASELAAKTKRVRRQAVKRRVRQVMDGVDLATAAKLEAALRKLDRDPETKAPKVNTEAVGMSKVVSELEYDAMMAGARSDRQRLFLEALWSTGIRVSELTGARWADCEQDGDVMRVRILGKGKKERKVRISADLAARIAVVFNGSRYLFETSGGKPYSRSYVSGQIARLGRRLLGRRISAHSMRHSFATRVYAATGKLEAVSRFLGHSSVAITLGMYVHEELTDEELGIRKTGKAA